MGYDSLINELVQKIRGAEKRPEMLAFFAEIKSNTLSKLELLPINSLQKNQKKFENQLRIVFFNTCDEQIKMLCEKNNPLWQDLLHLIYRQEILGSMVMSFFLKKGYISSEEKEYLEEIVDEIEEKLLKQARYILQTALYLRCYVKKMARNITINYCNRKMIKHQMIKLIDDEEMAKNPDCFFQTYASTFFQNTISAYNSPLPDSELLEEEKKQEIRAAYEHCQKPLNEWQKMLVSIILDRRKNLYHEYMNANLVENAIKKGCIKRSYTYQAVKNHANMAMKILRDCMKKELHDLS
jgi:hypothetical protein